MLLAKKKALKNYIKVLIGSIRKAGRICVSKKDERKLYKYAINATEHMRVMMKKKCGSDVQFSEGKRINLNQPFPIQSIYRHNTDKILETPNTSYKHVNDIADNVIQTSRLSQGIEKNKSENDITAPPNP